MGLLRVASTRMTPLLMVAVLSALVVMLTITGYAAGTKKPSPIALSEWEAGFKLYQNRRYSEAIEHFDAALAVDASYFRAWNGKGICLAFMGRLQEGLRYINRSLELNARYENGYFNRALAMALSHRWQDAIDSYAEALAIVPTNPWSYYGQACSYGMMGDAKGAAKALKQAIALDPQTRRSAQTEGDLDRVRNDPRVVALLKGGPK